MHPQPCAQKGVARPRTSVLSGGTGKPGHPARNGVTTYTVLSSGRCSLRPSSRGSRFVCARLGRRASAGLDPSIRGGTTRLRCPFRYRSSCAIFHQLTGSTEWPPALPTEITPDTAASIASHPASVTIAIRPSCGIRRKGYRVFRTKREQEYFFPWGVDRCETPELAGFHTDRVAWIPISPLRSA